MFGWRWKGEDEKKQGEKSGEMMFLICVWLERREEKKLMGSECFLLGSTKMFSPKIGEKTREKMFGQKTLLY